MRNQYRGSRLIEVSVPYSVGRKEKRREKRGEKRGGVPLFFFRVVEFSPLLLCPWHTSPLNNCP